MFGFLGVFAIAGALQVVGSVSSSAATPSAHTDLTPSGN
jgi:hypothetical protein